MIKNTHINRMNAVIEQLSNRSSFDAIVHEHREGKPMPSVEVLSSMVKMIRSLLFPGYFCDTVLCAESLADYTSENIQNLFNILSEQILAGMCFAEVVSADKFDGCQMQAAEKTLLFIERLPVLRALLSTDVEATYNGDPAAHSYSEVILCYPGIRAVSSYRIAHELYKLGVPLIPRIITELAHFETGIDIHPEAQIGNYFTIDHGTGVVIGATCIIGHHVQIYQGVTLGAKSFPLDENGNPIKGIPRHPIIEDNVIIYSNATVLGRITVGKGAMIGGNVWVTEDVVPNARILQTEKKF